MHHLLNMNNRIRSSFLWPKCLLLDTYKIGKRTTNNKKILIKRQYKYFTYVEKVVETHCFYHQIAHRQMSEKVIKGEICKGTQFVHKRQKYCKKI